MRTRTHKIIEAGVRELRRHQVLLTRQQWLKEAERWENEGAIRRRRTCEANIKATIAMDIEEDSEDWIVRVVGDVV